MIGLVFFALAISYIDRANLAVAAPTMRAELGIDATSMGLILSGFFWTYALMQLPFGWFADRVGPRVAFSIAVVWWSIFTAATALARGFGSLMGYRLLLGVGEAGANPSSVKVISAWFSVRERGFAASIFDSGVRIGPVITLPLVAWLINSFGWQTSFVATSLLGLVWVVVWLWLYREPEQHPSVTPEQLKILQSERGRPTSTEEDHAKLSWIGLFRYRTIWAMMIGFFCLNFAFYFFITWFPTYLVQARGFSLAQLGTLGMLPVLVASPGSWLGGLTSDFLYRRGWSLTAARKTCLVGAMLMSSVITLAVISTNVYVMLCWRQCLVAAKRRGADRGPCCVHWRYSELRFQPGRNPGVHVHGRHADNHGGLVRGAARNRRRAVYRRCRGLPVHARPDRTASPAGSADVGATNEACLASWGCPGAAATEAAV
jgi:sugar phosphate permease